MIELSEKTRMKSMIAHIIDEEILNTQFPQETEQQFIRRIYNQITQELTYLKRFADTDYFHEICDEIEDQVIEVYRIKTYGYTDLRNYRKHVIRKIG